MVVEFRLLGDVQVDIDGRAVDVGHARQRAVLATLLVEANQVVPGAALVERVWGARKLPARPANALQTYVTLLRRALAGCPAVSIDWRAPGYQLTADPETVDLLRFRELIAEARAGADEHRAGLLERALRLWRGEPFGTLDTDWLNQIRATLGKQRHAAQLDLTDIRLRRGEHANLVPDLAEQAAEHPLDERLAAQLITACYRGGHKADALSYYQQIRARLADELGIDPSPPLQALHQRVLTADPALAVPRMPARSRRTIVPQQLPAPPRRFAGRAQELGLLDAAVRSAGVLAIAAITGTGGIGKSWLALHWAHRNLDRFPDGQLFVNLRGFDPSGEPMPADVAVRGFLDALGVDAGSVPTDPDARTALYRSLVAGKRMLIVLDNARDSGHVESLLPGSPSCTVLITSRQRLGGLLALHGAHAIELDVLAECEAGELLRTHLGAERTVAEPNATAELLAACAGLPLALGIVAVRAAGEPGFPLALLAEELRESAARLDALDIGELSVNVRAVLSWSRATLEPEAATVFALLGLAPGPDIGLPGAVALTGLPAARVRAVLRALENAHLVQQHRPGRYRMHDLIRLYAAERVRVDLPKDSRCAGLHRLVDFYLHTAAAGELVLSPHREPIQLADPLMGSHPIALPDQTGAMAWFDAEHLCLLAAQRMAAQYGWFSRVWQIPWTLSTFHRRRGYFRLQRDTWLAGLDAAAQAGDPAAQILALRQVALACAPMGRHPEAADHLTRALDLALATGDLRAQAHTHQAFGVLWEAASSHIASLHHLIRALRLFHITGTAVQEAEARTAVARQLARLGHYRHAQTQCDLARTLLRPHNHPEALASTLSTLHFIAHAQGHHEAAILYAQQALAIYRTLGHTHLEATTLNHLTTAHAALSHRHLTPTHQLAG